MNSKESIEKAVRDAVKSVTGIICIEKDTSLIDKELNINPVDFLYIFEKLEKKFQIPAHEILISHTFEVMTVENLADALFKLLKCG